MINKSNSIFKITLEEFLNTSCSVYHLNLGLNKFNNKPKMDYGIEIPVELIKNTESSSNQGLGRFMKQNNIPIINLDLNLLVQH